MLSAICYCFNMRPFVDFFMRSLADFLCDLSIDFLCDLSIDFLCILLIDFYATSRGFDMRPLTNFSGPHLADLFTIIKEDYGP